MKIAFLFGSLNRGGLETLLLDVCNNIKKTDFEAVALYRKDGVLRKDFENSRVKFTHLSVGKNILTYIIHLRRFLKREGVTIAHAQQPLDAIFAYFASLGTQTKVVLTLHGFDFTGSKRLLKFILPKTATNLFVSNYQRDYYINSYRLMPDKQHVIYNGVNFSKITLAEEHKKDTLRKELSLSDNTILMGMVGNFNFVRNQLFVCQFLKALKDKEVDFHFVFVGKRVENSADRYDRCVEFCKQNDLMSSVSFLGVRNDVPDILSQLDVFIYATEHDTFGIAVVEAIASGIPVFVNDWDVMEEITDNGKLANLYKTDNKTDLLEKFMLFLQDKNTYKQKALQNASVVREKFSIEKHIQELKKLYQSF